MLLPSEHPMGLANPECRGKPERGETKNDEHEAACQEPDQRRFRSGPDRVRAGCSSGRSRCSRRDEGAVVLHWQHVQWRGQLAYQRRRLAWEGLCERLDANAHISCFLPTPDPADCTPAALAVFNQILKAWRTRDRKSTRLNSS